MGRVHIDLDVQDSRHAADALSTDTEGIDFVIQFDPQFFQPVLRAACFQFGHVDGFHCGLFRHQCRFFGRAANADTENAGRAPARAHFPDSLKDVIDH